MMGVDRGQLPWQRNLVGVLLEGMVVCLVFRTEITELLVAVDLRHWHQHRGPR